VTIRARPAITALVLACLAARGGVACASLDGLSGEQVPVDGGATPTDGAVDATSPEAAACSADTNTDPKNCGRCAHDCQGGDCQAGKCVAVQLASIAGAPLSYVVEAGPHLFASAFHTRTTENGGIWRVPKVGGAAELYVSLILARQLAVLGDTLYFVVTDGPADDAGATGGLYACPVDGPAPCSPTLIARATYPEALTIDKGSVFYGEQSADSGVMRFAPPGPPTVFRADYQPAWLFVDGPALFYTVPFFSPPGQVSLMQVFPNNSFAVASTYATPFPSPGPIVGSAAALVFTGFDTDLPAGLVRRVPRPGSAVPACDFGGTTNKRPYGLHVDGSRVYWTNQGEGAEPPYTKGSVASCETSGCCATPDIHWSGDWPTGLTGDATTLYFVTGNTFVWKVAKP
jgi:hypothetical protein